MEELFMTIQTKIFAAKKIITLYPEQPFANAVAIKDGRILAVGELNDIMYRVKQSPFTPYEVDTTLQEKVLMPGLIDPHTHVELQGLIYSGLFIAQIPWPRPEGGFYPVYPTKADVLKRLKELDKELPPGQLLYGVAYDENKAGGGLHVADLDAVSTTRPVLVSNLVFHRFWVNSFILKKAGIGSDKIPPGVEKDSNGKPNGTLTEHKGLFSVISAIPELVSNPEKRTSNILPLFVAGGCTTVCEASLGALGIRGAVNSFHALMAKPEVKLRVVGLPWWSMGIAEAGSLEKFIDLYREVKAGSADKFRIGAVKLYIDGSIISHTTPLGWPGYWDGSPEGNMAQNPEEIKSYIIRLHEAGISTITHTNTAAAFQFVLDAVKEAQNRCYRPDMRHRADHCYNITEAQLRLAKELGVTVSFFSTQICYYGDEHLRIQGPDRAHQITPIGTARRLGVSWTFHNDPPGTPQLPWVGAWAAVQRKTMESGLVLGAEQRVTVEDALRAMTIEAAYQLHLNNEIGSIEFGKKADFCVLEADPLEIDPLELKDIPVWGTVFGGELNPAKGGK
jgi:predicted amidohydrolase YtcJ